MQNIGKWLLIIISLFSQQGHADLPVVSHHGMAVSEHRLASEIGAEILKQGGNAIDAAVAMGYALAVVSPCCGNVGGGGFMLIHFANNKNIVLNFREKAPLAANQTMYLDKKGRLIPDVSLRGYLAVAVPGTVMGLNTALKKYGTMSLSKVISPAIELAEKGFILTSYDANLLKDFYSDFKKEPNVAAIFLKNNKPYQTGDRLIQKNLANTLKLISQHGSDAFYHGKITDEIIQASKQYGGILSQQDFSRYTVEELNPIDCSYRDYTIISVPPPSSGGVVLCQMLNIIEPYPLSRLHFHSAQTIHYLAEAMRYAYADRNRYLGDPVFWNNPIEKLISKKYAAEIRDKIANFRAISEMNIMRDVKESTNTTHYSVIDQYGNAVAVTYTIDSYFGAQVIAGNTGFFLNNEMDDFTAKPGEPNQFGLFQGEANTIQPGKRPLSSMAPTMIMRNGKLMMILGTPGGSTIPTTILQTFLNVDHGMNIQDAVNAPRIHFQGTPDAIKYEPNALSYEALLQLRMMGYRTEPWVEWGAVEAIMIDPDTGTLYGASDRRRQSGEAKGF